MVGYHLENTLSENGSVNRGVCVVDDNNLLKNVVECINIKEDNGVITSEGSTIKPQSLVSMNMWGFTPDYFDHSFEMFKEFLSENGSNPKSEFYIPSVVNELITQGKSTCVVLETPSKWFGMTYAADRDGVISRINELVKSGAYPERLFK